MAKQSKRIIILLFGLLLWIFFIFQEEMANYGLYTLVNYSTHEIAVFIPYLGIILTTAWAIYLLICIVKKRSDKSDKVFVAVLSALVILQGAYLHNVSNTQTTSVLVTVESIDEQQGEIVAVGVGQHDAVGKIVLKTPMLASHMMKTDGQEYYITYEHYKNNPTKGTLHMVW